MSRPQNPQNFPFPPQPQSSQQPYPQTQQHPQSPQQWTSQQQTPSPGYPGGPHPPQNRSGGYGQKPPKQKKPLLKRWWFWLIVVIVVIAVFSAIGGGADEAGTDSAETNSADGQQSEGSAEDESAEDSAETSHGIGDTVAADDWEITVESVEDGVSSVGDDFLGAEAQGQFVQVAMSVKNTGSDPNFFFEDDIKLADDEGNTYSADSEAGIYAVEDNILFLEEINPGNTAEGVLVFDVPDDVDPNQLTFAGGLFSDPVEISLK